MRRRHSGQSQVPCSGPHRALENKIPRGPAIGPPWRSTWLLLHTIWGCVPIGDLDLYYYRIEYFKNYSCEVPGPASSLRERVIHSDRQKGKACNEAHIVVLSEILPQPRQGDPSNLQLSTAF